MDNDHKITVLVASDDQTQLMYCRNMLELCDFRVVSSTGSKEEIIAKLIQSHPSVLALDCDGSNEADECAAISAVNAIAPESRIIVLFPEPKAAEKMEKLGVDLFLMKPFRREHFLLAVNVLSKLKPSTAILEHHQSF